MATKKKDLRKRVQSHSYYMSEKRRDQLRQLFPDQYAFNVGDIYNVCPFPLSTLIHGGSKREFVQWRQLIMFYNFMNGMTLQDAGEEVGRDHATVLHSIKLIEEAIGGFYAELKEKIDLVMSASEDGIVNSIDHSVNEMISLSFLESEFLKKFPNLAEKRNTFLFGC